MSTSKCHACGRGGYEERDLDSILGGFYNDDSYYNDYRYEWWGSRAQVGQWYWVPAIGEVTLVHKKTDHPDDYSTASVFLVFEIDGVLYRKEGSSSSYETEWDGVFKVTEAKTREVVYYE